MHFFKGRMPKSFLGMMMEVTIPFKGVFFKEPKPRVWRNRNPFSQMIFSAGSFKSVFLKLKR